MLRKGATGAFLLIPKFVQWLHQAANIDQPEKDRGFSKKEWGINDLEMINNYIS